MIKILVLLYGYYNSNLDKCCVLCFFCAKSFIYMPYDIKNNKKNNLEQCVYTNKYNYSNRGYYHYPIYIVQPGDTLFYIAWISGNNYTDLAYYNNIKNINLIKVGQRLIVRFNARFLYSEKLLKIIFYSMNYCNSTLKEFFNLIKRNFLFIQVYKKKLSHFNYINAENFFLINSDVIAHNSWHWPAYGKLVDTFSASEGGNKGIDISGKIGQPILAVTNGKVVYVGNTLRGYGNLIVIRHNNDYLSVYAHNDMILVNEQQIVQIGDKIATMGNSGTNEVKLHFEIRYKGKSVNPMYYLSKRY